MPRVLVLYPGPIGFRQAQTRAHATLLEELDVHLVLADDCVVDTDRELFADVIEMPDAARLVEGLRVLEAWIARHRVDAVLAQSEQGLLLGALVACKLGVPAISPEAAHFTTNKLLCREALARARVPQPRFARASSAAGVRALARELGYPLVLKGVASALGRLVTLVESEREVDAAVRRVLAGLPESVDIRRLEGFARASGFELGCDPLREFLVEEFARGVPVETDGLVVGASVHTFGVTEQVLARPPLFYVEGYLLPADLPRHELEAIERTSDAALCALGLANTGFSVELRLQRGGCAEGDAARIIEVNGRLGWDEGFGDLFACISGVQPGFQALQLALGVEPVVQLQPGVTCALAYRTHYGDGIVKRVPTARDLAELEVAHGVRAGLGVYEGERTFAAHHPDIAPHMAWALAVDARSSRAAYARARSALERLELVIGGTESGTESDANGNHSTTAPPGAAVPGGAVVE